MAFGICERLHVHNTGYKRGTLNCCPITIPRQVCPLVIQTVDLFSCNIYKRTIKDLPRLGRFMAKPFYFLILNNTAAGPTVSM